jgi:hypothetical protein
MALKAVELAMPALGQTAKKWRFAVFGAVRRRYLFASESGDCKLNHA